MMLSRRKTGLSNMSCVKGMPTMHISYYFLPAAGLGMYSHWPWACARVCTCQCIYLMLSVGNVHVTVRNYECGVRGAVFQHVLTAEACFFKLSEPAAVALHPAACRKLPLKQSCRGQDVTAQHQNGMFLPGSRSSLQSQRGPEIIWDHRHMLHLFYSPPLSTFIYPGIGGCLFCAYLLCHSNHSNECCLVTSTSWLH